MLYVAGYIRVLRCCAPVHPPPCLAPHFVGIARQLRLPSPSEGSPRAVRHPSLAEPEYPDTPHKIEGLGTSVVKPVQPISQRGSEREREGEREEREKREREEREGHERVPDSNSPSISPFPGTPVYHVNISFLFRTQQMLFGFKATT